MILQWREKVRTPGESGSPGRAWYAASWFNWNAKQNVVCGICGKNTIKSEESRWDALIDRWIKIGRASMAVMINGKCRIFSWNLLDSLCGQILLLRAKVSTQIKRISRCVSRKIGSCEFVPLKLQARWRRLNVNKRRVYAHVPRSMLNPLKLKFDKLYFANFRFRKLEKISFPLHQLIISKIALLFPTI